MKKQDMHKHKGKNHLRKEEIQYTVYINFVRDQLISTTIYTCGMFLVKKIDKFPTNVNFKNIFWHAKLKIVTYKVHL